jgi:hypothetical protein
MSFDFDHELKALFKYDTHHLIGNRYPDRVQNLFDYAQSTVFVYIVSACNLR